MSCPFAASTSRASSDHELAPSHCQPGIGRRRGYDTIPLHEAAWRLVQPELVGMSTAELWHCAGPPLREATAASGAMTMVYRYADLKNYCEVTLVLEDGTVRSFSADHSAPEFLWLLDGANYCGRIFADCIAKGRNPDQRGTTLR